MLTQSWFYRIIVVYTHTHTHIERFKMKRFIVLASISIIASGCSTVNQYMSDRFTPLESAKKQCSELGLRLGTSDYAQCVQNLYAHKQSVNAARAANQPTMDSKPPQTTQCRQSGSYINCTTF